MSDKSTGKRGGFREGSGRKIGPDGPIAAVSVSIPGSVLADLDAWADGRGLNRSQALTEAAKRLLRAAKRATK